MKVINQAYISSEKIKFLKFYPNKKKEYFQVFQDKNNKALNKINFQTIK
jgi:hypothetical protein